MKKALAFLMAAVAEKTLDFAALLEIARSNEPQMAALQRALRQTGQIAAGADAQTVFQLPCQRAIAHGAAPVEDDTTDAAVRREVEKALHRRQDGKGRPSGIDHQHHGALGLPRHLVGAGPGGGEAQPVIIAHDALDHRNVAAIAVVRQQIAHGVAVKKERVEIRAFRADNTAVEHGVDIIRAAFRRAYPQAPRYQRLQDGTGDGGLAAAAVGAGRSEEHTSELQSQR